MSSYTALIRLWSFLSYEWQKNRSKNAWVPKGGNYSHPNSKLLAYLAARARRNVISIDFSVETTLMCQNMISWARPGMIRLRLIQWMKWKVAYLIALRSLESTSSQTNWNRERSTFSFTMRVWTMHQILPHEWVVSWEIMSLKVLCEIFMWTDFKDFMSFKYCPEITSDDCSTNLEAYLKR